MLFLIKLLSGNVYSQTELRLYAGLSDYPGISIEKMYKNFGFEVGGSFKRKEKNIEWHGPSTQRTDKSFVNFAFKKYFRENYKSSFFIGSYMRLRSINNYTLNPFTPERTAFADTVGQRVTYATRKDKFSVGVLVGYKWLFGNHLVIETNFGLGFAPYYKITEKSYYYPDLTHNYDGDEFAGRLEQFSIYSHLIIGYRFGKPPKKQEMSD